MRNYSSIASEKTLSDALTISGTVLKLTDVNNLPVPPFTLVLEPDTTREEIVTATEVSGTQLTISRGEDGTDAYAHDLGTKARHMITGRDLQEVHDHMDKTEDVHGITDATFLVYENKSQTLTGKTISGSSNTITNIAQSSVTNLTSDLASKASSTDLANHEADTTSIHGIANTALLVKSIGNGKTIFVQSAQPTANAVGDIWFQVTGL